MAKKPVYKTLRYQSVTLTAWVHQDRTLVKLRSVSAKHFDQMRLAAHAATHFPDYLQDTEQGLLFDIRALGDLMRSVGLASQAADLPALEHPIAKAASVSVKAQGPTRMRVMHDLSPERIRRMYELMCDGHSQTYAAGLAGLGEATASRLRRGLLNKQMSAEGIQTWAETFGSHTTLQKIRVKAASPSVDDKNAALLPQLYTLIRVKGLTFRQAGELLGISTSKACRLVSGTYKSAGIKTHAAHKSCFGARPGP
jgi:hypothetical protein